MFWVNLALLALEGMMAVLIARVIVRKPKEKRVAFYILIGVCLIPFSLSHHWIIKPAVKTWFAQKEMMKRLMEVPSYREVNKQDLEVAYEYFYTGHYEKAAEYYKNALRDASESKAELNYRIGLSYYMAGGYDACREYWEAAKKVNPEIFKLRTFYIPSSSMAPTLLIGDYVIGDIEYYRHRDPARGDVILFMHPKQKEKVWVGRIIGMPEEVIQIKEKETVINNAVFSDRYANFETSAEEEKSYRRAPLPTYLGPEKIPKGSYFILGDNRNHSQDSRYIGYVQKDLILGKVLAIYASLAVKYKKEGSGSERAGKRIE